MKKCNALAVAASCVGFLLGGCAGKVPDDAWPGYRTDGKGQLLKTADGHCWRTADWTEIRPCRHVMWLLPASLSRQ